MSSDGPPGGGLIVQPRRSRSWLIVLAIAVLAVAAFAIVYRSGALAPTRQYTVTLTQSAGAISDEEVSDITTVVTARAKAVKGNVDSVARDGQDGIVVKATFPESFTRDQVTSLFVSTGRLEFVDVESIADSATVAALASGDEGVQLKPGTYTAIVTGDGIRDASVGTDSVTNRVVISLRMTAEGTKVWAEYTTSHIGKQVAIVLDGRVRSAPVVLEPITDGRTEISGEFTAEEAQNLQAVLQSGALPRTYSVKEIR